MQVELFPGISTLLLGPDGNEVGFAALSNELGARRTSSYASQTGHFLTADEEMIVLQRLKRHKDFLRESGYSNDFVAGTDGFGASLGASGRWDLGIFQENLRRGVEQIVRSMKPGNGPQSTSSQTYSPSRSPSLYGRQTQDINRIVSTLQDVYFSVTGMKQTSKTSLTNARANAPSSSWMNKSGWESSYTTDVSQGSISLPQHATPNLQSTPNYSFGASPMTGTPNQSMRSAPPDIMHNQSFGSASFTDNTAQKFSPGSAMQDYPQITDSVFVRRGKPSISEEVFRTQQMTEALKPQSAHKNEPSSALKWTKSLTRRKSKKRLNRTISNPHLVSTTQNLDNTIDLGNFPVDTRTTETAVSAIQPNIRPVPAMFSDIQHDEKASPMPTSAATIPTSRVRSHTSANSQETPITPRTSHGSSPIRKSLLVNMGIQEPSPLMKDAQLPPPPKLPPKLSTRPTLTQPMSVQAPSNSIGATHPFYTHIPGLGALDTNGQAVDQSVDNSMYTSKSFAGTTNVGNMSQSMEWRPESRVDEADSRKSIISSHAGDVITFPFEKDTGEGTLDIHTDHIPEFTTTTPLKKPLRSSKVSIVKPGTPRWSPGHSVYDMYLDKSADEDSIAPRGSVLRKMATHRDAAQKAAARGLEDEHEMLKLASPAERYDAGRESRFFHGSRAEADTSSIRFSRNDNPIWQVLGGLHDRSSMYSEMEQQNKRLSDMSLMSRRDDPRALDRNSVSSDHESARLLFKKAATVQQTAPEFANFDLNEVLKTRNSPSPIPSDFESLHEIQRLESAQPSQESFTPHVHAKSPVQLPAQSPPQLPPKLSMQSPPLSLQSPQFPQSPLQLPPQSPLQLPSQSPLQLPPQLPPQEPFPALGPAQLSVAEGSPTLDERGMPVQVVYYNDDELPQIMDQIAEGNSSARIEFRRRSTATNKEGETQLTRMEQSILSLLRPTYYKTP
ncbi:hypothetical protein MVES1_003776 [Malassezia vespertilionis]|uniref:uncharacterized protein n=1 Tax=Malassezia vespertilionis TaxID=2020962 RepID=UPI0024B0FA42|nr:uncharacterized protein MVES1_003776 [Malassezia vespertilionis]WFD08404.1 hypothetical protein MVES1_003776 [Malassezia vespertilionis]